MTYRNIGAVILAAGKSTRMGRQKMLLPWGETTVLGKVIQSIRFAGLDEIVVVTHSEIESTIHDPNLSILLNADGEMLSSLQAGLRGLNPLTGAAVVCLGDQPQIEERSVKSVCDAYLKSGSSLVVPSYNMRRGHPWLVGKPLWGEILQMEEGSSMRRFLTLHTREIEYVTVQTPSILQDLDTPEDYLKYKPRL